MTTSDPHGHAWQDNAGRGGLPRVELLVRAAVREARDVVARLELIADSRIATPGAVGRRAAQNALP